MAHKIKRFDIYWTNLDPTIGAEIQKKRPCVIISPNEIHFLKTYLIAPITSKTRQLPTRIPITLKGIDGEIVLDQIRAIDQTRLLTYIDHLNNTTADKMLAILQEMFTK